jgi:7-cyano-7-deazaguanine synthase
MGGASLTRRALLLSGGMDSTALAWGLRPDLAITIDYGQLAAAGEIRASAAVCHALGVRHRIIRVDCRCLGSGDMAGTDSMSFAPVSEWWPFRNQLIITLGAAAALQEEMGRLAIGTVTTDAAHADGRREFFEAMNALLQMQEGGLVLETPAVEDTTVSLCQRVSVPFEFLAWSHSCHVSERACGLCRGCCKHRGSMRELGHGEY